MKTLAVTLVVCRWCGQLLVATEDRDLLICPVCQKPLAGEYELTAELTD
jgi:uncharacterized CHY-type Zn-finger protein